MMIKRGIGRLRCFFVFIGLCIAAPALAQSPDAIVNYREYSALYSRSGQPTDAQFETLIAHHCELVSYLAYLDVGT